MPTYEYRCPKGHEFELFQRMSDEPRAPCPECGEVSERILSAGAGFLFKGEGFYITDYRSESYQKAANAEKEGGEKPTTKETKGTGTDGQKEGGSSASDSKEKAKAKPKSDSGTGPGSSKKSE
jgi:putative FmdB family regulatory protein